LLNLGDCYEKLGRTASAWAVFRDAEASAHRTADHLRAEAAHARVVALEPRLSRLTIVVPREENDSITIRRDGAVVSPGLWGASLPVDPGRITIEAAGPGKKAWSSTVDVTTTPSASVSVPMLEDDPGARASLASSTAPREAPSGHGPETKSAPYRTAAVVAGGLGIAAAVIGTVFGTMALSKRDQALTYCSADHRCDPPAFPLRDDARSAGTISTVAFVTGGVALAAGLVLWFAAPSRTTATVSPAASRSSAAGAF
jgi:hypothetical protein